MLREPIEAGNFARYLRESPLRSLPEVEPQWLTGVDFPNRGPNVAYEAFLEMGLQQDVVYTGCCGFF